MKSGSLDRKTPGFSELKQNLTYNKDKRANLPTWDFVHRGTDGVPLLSISNAFMLMGQEEGESRPQYLYSQKIIDKIKEEAAKRVEGSKKEIESKKNLLRKN